MCARSLMNVMRAVIPAGRRAATKAIREMASRLEIREEQAAELVAEIKVHGLEWTPRETRGLTFQDWLELMDLGGKTVTW